MRIGRNPIPFKAGLGSTGWTRSAVDFPPLLSIALVSVACAATLTIWNSDPFVRWGYEAAVFLLAAFACLRAPIRANVPGVLLAVISLWGFAQLATGQTQYRWATVNRSLDLAALAATALAGCIAFRRPPDRALFVRALGWFGFAVSVVSVLAYFTSPGKSYGYFRALTRTTGARFPAEITSRSFSSCVFRPRCTG